MEAEIILVLAIPAASPEMSLFFAIEILWTEWSCDPQGRGFKYIPNAECVAISIPVYVPLAKLEY